VWNVCCILFGKDGDGNEIGAAYMGMGWRRGQFRGMGWDGLPVLIFTVDSFAGRRGRGVGCKVWGRAFFSVQFYTKVQF